MSCASEARIWVIRDVGAFQTPHQQEGTFLEVGISLSPRISRTPGDWGKGLSIRLQSFSTWMFGLVLSPCPSPTSEASLRRSLGQQLVLLVFALCTWCLVVAPRLSSQP